MIWQDSQSSSNIVIYDSKSICRKEVHPQYEVGYRVESRQVYYPFGVTFAGIRNIETTGSDDRYYPQVGILMCLARDQAGWFQKLQIKIA